MEEFAEKIGFAVMAFVVLMLVVVVMHYVYKFMLNTRCRLLHHVSVKHWTTDMPFGIGGYVNHWGVVCERCDRVLGEMSCSDYDKIKNEEKKDE